MCVLAVLLLSSLLFSVWRESECVSRREGRRMRRGNRCHNRVVNRCRAVGEVGEVSVTGVGGA